MEIGKNSEILSWIEQSLEGEFVQQEVLIADKTVKPAKYAGDMVFATVNGVDKEGNEKVVNLVIKIGIRNDKLRKQVPMLNECYKREILIYDEVLPSLRKFRAEKTIANFDAVPKCFRTFLSESSEVLVLEDLTQQGYMLHDLKKPMNLQHVKLVLSKYAEFHALSFALLDQRIQEYRKISSIHHHEHNIKMLGQLSELFKFTEARVKDTLGVQLRYDLVKQFEDAVGGELESRLIDILEDDVEHSVITHGGYHKKNFLFHYEEEDHENPTKMVMLDWQVSIQHSPVMDLSGFLYSVGTEHIHKLPELLEFYHSMLASSLADLGTDIAEVFPFAALLEHWKRYSFYGFAFFLTSSVMLFGDNREESDVDRIRGGINEFLDGSRHLDCDEYRKWLVQVIDQYFSYKV